MSNPTRGDDVSNNTDEVRFRIPPEDKSFLEQVALACQTDVPAVLRPVISEFLARKRHEYRLAARFAKAQGITRDSRGDSE